MTQEQALSAAWFAATIFFYGLAWFLALAAVMSIWPLWIKIKNWANKERQSGQRIIVGLNEQAQKTIESIEILDKTKAEKQLEIEEKDALVLARQIELYELQSKYQSLELQVSELEIKKFKIEHPEDLDYSELTMNQLKAKAKDLGVTGYSRLKKPELVDAITDALAVANNNTT